MNDDTHTTSDLLHDVISDVQEIIRSEVRLAKTEAKEEASKAGGAVGMFAGAGILALFGLVLFEGMGVVLWALLTPLWIAFLIMAVINLLTGAIFYAGGRERWRKVHPVPKTVTTLKEDLEWARNQTR
jgi:uncharacterized membrane protein YqjE